MKWGLLLFLFLSMSCQKDRGELRLYFCPNVNEVSSFLEGMLKEKVYVSDVKGRGSLCFYRILYGEEKRPANVYISEGVLVVGIGIDMKTRKPYPEEDHEKVGANDSGN